MFTAPDIAAAADCPALLATDRRRAILTGARSTPAAITWLKPNAGGATDTTGLLALRERLIADLREARRRHRSTCDLICHRNAVTLEILRRCA